MKKGTAIVICFLLILVSWIPTISSDEPVFATTLYVGGSGAGNYTTIQSAIDAASSGDTVFVYSGTYYENIKIHNQIHLIGEDRDNTIIDGRNKSSVITIEIPNVAVCHFSLVNSNIINNPVIKVSNYSNYNIYDNIIKNGFRGIKLLNVNNGNIYNNSIGPNFDESGIAVTRSEEINIFDNQINNNGYDGIELHKSNNNYIHDNQIISNRHAGISLYYSSDNSIITNNINNNYNGIILLYSNPSYGLTTNNQISNNIITENKFSGFEMLQAFENSITNNVIEDNNYFGIKLGNDIPGYSNYTTATNTFQFNSIKNHEYGFHLHNSFDNTFFSNNIIENDIDVDFFIKNPKDKNYWNENYWNKPLFIPKMIVGSTLLFHINIPWIQIDWHPAKEPYDYNIPGPDI